MVGRGRPRWRALRLLTHVDSQCGARRTTAQHGQLSLSAAIPYNQGAHSDIQKVFFIILATIRLLISKLLISALKVLTMEHSDQRIRSNAAPLGQYNHEAREARSFRHTRNYFEKLIYHILHLT